MGICDTQFVMDLCGINNPFVVSRMDVTCENYRSASMTSTSRVIMIYCCKDNKFRIAFVVM